MAKPIEKTLPLAEIRLREAKDRHEAERKAYLDTLDPRHRADLAPWDPGTDRLGI